MGNILANLLILAKALKLSNPNVISTKRLSEHSRV